MSCIAPGEMSTNTMSCIAPGEMYQLDSIFSYFSVKTCFVYSEVSLQDASNELNMFL